MNGCGGRWLEKLQPFARWHPSGAIRTRRTLPCSAIRSLSHGTSLLSRVTRRKQVSSPGKTALENEARFTPPEDRTIRGPPHDTPPVPGPQLPVKESRDAEGRKYCESAIMLLRPVGLPGVKRCSTSCHSHVGRVGVQVSFPPWQIHARRSRKGSIYGKSCIS